MWMTAYLTLNDASRSLADDAESVAQPFLLHPNARELHNDSPESDAASVANSVPTVAVQALRLADAPPNHVSETRRQG